MLATTTTTTFTFAFVLLDKFSSLTLASLVEPLRIANYCGGDQLYNWKFVSVDGTSVASSSGIPVATEAIQADDNTRYDAVIICGGWNTERYDNADLLRWLRSMGRQGLILGATETGPYVLARAGLLSGYKTTLHWHCHNAFEENFPDTELTEQLFVIDRKRMTSAGGTACLDMMLYDIENRHSKSLALEVADQVIYDTRREPETPQKKAQQNQHMTPPAPLQNVIDVMQYNIEEPIPIPELCKLLDISQRKLERLFNRHYNCSAVAFYRVLRLQHARVLLTQTNMSVLDIGIACGFSSSSYFSKSYSDLFHVRPRDHRTAWPDNEVAPYWPGVTTSVTSKPDTVNQH